MCDPATALTAAGMGMSAVGQISAGNAKSKAINSQAALAVESAKLNVTAAAIDSAAARIDTDAARINQYAAEADAAALQRQGQFEIANAEIQAQVMEYNGLLAENKARLASEAATIEAGQVANFGRALSSTQRTGYAKSGVEVNSGSSVEVIAQSAADVELSRLRTVHTGQLQEAAFLIERDNALINADLLRFQAINTAEQLAFQGRTGVEVSKAGVMLAERRQELVDLGNPIAQTSVDMARQGQGIAAGRAASAVTAGYFGAGQSILGGALDIYDRQKPTAPNETASASAVSTPSATIYDAIGKTI